MFRVLSRPPLNFKTVRRKTFHPMPEPEITDIRILRVIEQMASDFNQDFDFNQIAADVNLSPSRLRHLFKEQTGISFKKYIRQVRMKQAQKLLETTFLSVKEIAKKVGIRDGSHFVRYFKEEYGLSPKQYRKDSLLNNKS